MQPSWRVKAWASVCVFGLLGLGPAGPQPSCAAQPPAGEDLIQSDSFAKQWFFFSADSQAKRDETWVLRKSTDGKETILVCQGKKRPFGYLRTTRSFSSFKLRLEWMYPEDANGNSGILVYTDAVGEAKTPGDKIWPKSIQIQLHRPKAGSVFPSGGATTDNTLDVKDLSAPVKQWNTCVITAQAGTLTVAINDKTVGRVTGCVPNAGSLALQSEGSEIHFRNIRLEPFPKP